MDHCPHYKNRALLFMLIFWVQRGQRSVWHAEYNKAGGSVILISLCEAGSQQTCRRSWYVLALLVTAAQHSKTQPQTHQTCHCHKYRGHWQHAVSDCLTFPIKEPSLWGQGRSQTLAFAENNSGGVVSVPNILVNVPECPEVTLSL